MTTSAPVRPQTPPRDPVGVIAAVTAACWAATLALTFLGDVGPADHDVVLEQLTWPWALRLLAFLAIWTVMLGAMMLPTTLTMARMFTAVSARAEHALAARFAFYATYLLVWAGFALVALAADSRLHWLVDRWHWLHHHEPLILASALVLAGGFQLTPLKDACLRACRSPLSLVGQHYRDGAAGGWRVGSRHAVSCLGCCWALMLVMFATGVGSLAWMVVLTGVMVTEKVAPGGQRLVRPLAAALLLAGLGVGATAFV
jgi:predicted metal-binding membrane protein